MLDLTNILRENVYVYNTRPCSELKFFVSFSVLFYVLLSKVKILIIYISFYKWIRIIWLQSWDKAWNMRSEFPSHSTLQFVFYFSKLWIDILFWLQINQTKKNTQNRAFLGPFFLRVGVCHSVRSFSVGAWLMGW